MPGCPGPTVSAYPYPWPHPPVSWPGPGTGTVFVAVLLQILGLLPEKPSGFHDFLSGIFIPCQAAVILRLFHLYLGAVGFHQSLQFLIANDVGHCVCMDLQRMLAGKEDADAEQ